MREKKFQFTPLREGRRFHAHSKNTSLAFQFTPLREGRHYHRLACVPHPLISIHAPPRGATVHGVCWGYWNLISIHAPPRGATVLYNVPVGLRLFQFTPLREGRQTRWRSRPRWARFQFTPLREGRLLELLQMGAYRSISIHAPPRGATTATAVLSISYLFQFTPLREGRLVPLLSSHAEKDFNSRPSARGDPYSVHFTPFHSISIHAPPRGATSLNRRTAAVPLFQFTPLREGRLYAP